MKSSTKQLLSVALALCVISSVHITLNQTTSNSSGLTFTNLDQIGVHKLPREVRKKARAEYEWEMARDPKTNVIPRDARQSELAYKKESQLFKTTSDAFEWEQAGPYKVGGRTRGFAIDVANSSNLIAAGVSGGIWKSTDKGGKWELKTPDYQNKNVTWIAQDPRSGNTNIWYAVTGEFDGNSAGSPSSGYRGIGVFKSTDNGETWNLLPNATNPNITSWNSPFDYMSKVAVNPVNGDVYIAANGGVILKSTDGGTNFTTVLGEFGSFYYCDIVITNDGKLISILSADGNDNSTDFPNSGIWKSEDNGANWTDITPSGFPTSYDRTVLALAPSNQDILYTFSNSGGSHYFFKVNHATKESEDRSANLPYFSQSGDDAGFFSTQGGYDMILAVKPDDENFVILGAVNLYRSTDAFATKPFTSATPTQTDRNKSWIGGYKNTDDGYSTFTNHHPDQHNFVFDPTNSNAGYSVHDGGVSYSTSLPNTTVSWFNKNNGYFVTQFYHGSISRFDLSKEMVGGAQDNGSPLFESGSISSDDASSGDGAYSYFGKTKLYTSYQNGNIHRFDINNGSIGYVKTVKPKNASARFIHPFDVDRNNEQIIYYPSGNGIFRTNDAVADDNTSWKDLRSVVKTRIGLTITAIESSIQPAHVLYFGGSDLTNPLNTPPYIYRLEKADTSSTAAPTELELPNASGGSYVADIALNPEDANEVLVVLSNYNVEGIYYTSNGSTFTAVEGNLLGNTTNRGPSVRSAAITKVNNEKVYVVGTTTGVYATRLLDGSNTVWIAEGSAVIGNAIVNSLSYREEDQNLVAFSHGRGAFYGVPNTIVANDEFNFGTVETFNLKQNYPNPFNPSTTIEFTLNQNAKVDLTVFDGIGRKVATLVNSDLSSGQHAVRFDASNLASGTYFYTLSSKGSNGMNFTQTKKMTLIK